MDNGEDQWFQTNLQRAGELFVLSLWIQSQMADLGIFATRPDLVGPFLSHPATVPEEFAALRLQAWQKDFGNVKARFVKSCAEWITESDTADLDFLHALRNAIAHSHVSMGRGYFLYRPTTKKELQVMDDLQLAPREGAASPPVVKVAFYDDAYYLRCFSVIKRLDEACMARVAAELGVIHSRIR